MEELGRNASYALGHSEGEMERLSTQARVFEPFTRRMLQQAGLSQGMRVLDVGCGTGDVTFLCASLVGTTGEVIGMDRAPAAVDKATERARAGQAGNVTFMVGGPGESRFEQKFDAVVGRLVLMHQPDPVAMLRELSGLIRIGGIIAFQEFDITATRSFPPSPTFEQCVQWISTAFTMSGTDIQMGLKLYSTYVAAGLAPPSMSLDAGIWGGENNPGAIMVSDAVRTLLPVFQKLGIAPGIEAEIDSLRSRIQQEISAGGGVTISPTLIGAWTQAG